MKDVASWKLETCLMVGLNVSFGWKGQRWHAPVVADVPDKSDPLNMALRESMEMKITCWSRNRWLSIQFWMEHHFRRNPHPSRNFHVICLICVWYVGLFCHKRGWSSIHYRYISVAIIRNPSVGWPYGINGIFTISSNHRCARCGPPVASCLQTKPTQIH